jgi:hypothetical protein
MYRTVRVQIAIVRATLVLLPGSQLTKPARQYGAASLDYCEIYGAPGSKSAVNLTSQMKSVKKDLLR